MTRPSRPRHLLIGAALLAAIVGGGTLAAASPAAAAPGQTKCVTDSRVGFLCVDETAAGYNAWFESYNSNITDLVDFTLWVVPEGAVGDAGAFHAYYATPPSTYFFLIGVKSQAHLCLYSRDYKFSPLCTANLYG